MDWSVYFVCMGQNQNTASPIYSTPPHDNFYRSNYPRMWFRIRILWLVITFLLGFDVSTGAYKLIRPHDKFYSKSWAYQSLKILSSASYILHLALQELERHICIVRNHIGSTQDNSRPSILTIWKQNDYTNHKWQKRIWYWFVRLVECW